MSHRRKKKGFFGTFFQIPFIDILPPPPKLPPKEVISLFGGPPAPAPAPAPKSAEEERAIEEEEEKERRKLRGKTGRISTILTSPIGASLRSSDVFRKTLLGG